MAFVCASSSRKCWPCAQQVSLDTLLDTAGNEQINRKLITRDLGCLTHVLTHLPNWKIPGKALKDNTNWIGPCWCWRIMSKLNIILQGIVFNKSEKNWWNNKLENMFGDWTQESLAFQPPIVFYWNCHPVCTDVCVMLVSV